MRRVILGTFVMALSFGLMVGSADAKKKKCKKLCKPTIAACIAANNCDSLTGKDKRLCKKECKKSTLEACKQNSDPDTCTAGSPSGAFLF